MREAPKLLPDPGSLASVQRRRDRVAWILRRVDGHSVAEVATLCECSPATAKRRIAAAAVAIEEVLGRD